MPSYRCGIVRQPSAQKPVQFAAVQLQRLPRPLWRSREKPCPSAFHRIVESSPCSSRVTSFVTSNSHPLLNSFARNLSFSSLTSDVARALTTLDCPHLSIHWVGPCTHAAGEPERPLCCQPSALETIASSPPQLLSPNRSCVKRTGTDSGLESW